MLSGAAQRIVVSGAKIRGIRYLDSCFQVLDFVLSGSEVSKKPNCNRGLQDIFHAVTLLNTDSNVINTRSRAPNSRQLHFGSDTDLLGEDERKASYFGYVHFAHGTVPNSLDECIWRFDVNPERFMQGQQGQLLSEEAQTPSEREIDLDTQPRKIRFGVRTCPVVSDRIALVCNA